MPDLGKKFECYNCGTKFYNLGRAEASHQPLVALFFRAQLIEHKKVTRCLSSSSGYRRQERDFVAIRYHLVHPCVVGVDGR